MSKLAPNDVVSIFMFTCPKCKEQTQVSGTLWEYLEFSYDNGVEKVSIGKANKVSMNKYIKFALNHHLSEYPEDWSYSQVVKAIVDEDESVVVWKAYDDGFVINKEDIVYLIDDMIVALTEEFSTQGEDMTWLDDLYSFSLPE